MKFELRPARPADVEAIMQVMADAMANLQHPEWFVPDDAVYMAEHISGPKGFCLVAEEKTTGALAAYFTVKLAGTAPDALGWQLGMSEEELNTTAQMDSCCVAPPYQGNGLEGKLLLMAEDTLRGSRYRHLLATVHPDNAASLYTGLHRGYTIAANHVICYGDKVRDILHKELESRNTNMNTTIRAMTPADKDSVMEMMRVFYNSPAVLSNGSDEIFARDIEGCISDNPYVEGYMFEQDGAVQGYGMAASCQLLVDSCDDERPPEADYGHYYQALYKSGFFNNPHLWGWAGSDADYQAWVREQASCVTGKRDWVESLGAGRCEYAHVRRVAGGGGISIKPDYWGVPLTHDEHRLQHLKGEAGMLADYGRRVDDAAAWFEFQLTAARRRLAERHT